MKPQVALRSATLSEADKAVVRQELARAERQYALFAERPDLLELVAVFLRHCSPRDPDRGALAVMSLYLYVLTYLGDQVSPSSLALDAQIAWRLITEGEEGEEPSRGSVFPRGLRGAAAELGARIRERMPPRRSGRSGAFACRLLLNFSAFVWRREHPGCVSGLEEHLELRTHDVSVLAYERLWGLLLGWVDEDDVRLSFGVEQLERASARVAALANELGSVGRDEAQGVANAVLIVEASGLARASALAAVRSLHEEALARFTSDLARARASALAEARDRLVAYLDFLGSCTLGNAAAMDELTQRYRS